VKRGAPSKPGFALDQNFFGFKPEYQVQIHEQLFDLLWAGDGRWQWDTIYNLPIHIRRMWISKINKERSRKNSEQQAAEEKAERHARLKKS
jgi:hypothetical protein